MLKGWTIDMYHTQMHMRGYFVYFSVYFAILLFSRSVSIVGEAPPSLFRKAKQNILHFSNEKYMFSKYIPVALDDPPFFDRRRGKNFVMLMQY